jgi:hypothetical protein
VPLKTYDESIAVLRRSLDAARLGDTDKLDGMARLDQFARHVEQQFEPSADVEATIAHERRISRDLGGRTVFDDRRPQPRPRSQSTPRQLNLFDSER